MRNPLSCVPSLAQLTMVLATAAGRQDATRVPRLATTAGLLAERGYALRAEALAALLGAPPEDVRAAARSDPSLVLEADHVVPRGSETLVAPSVARTVGHAHAAAKWRPVAIAYARSVARHVPWARVVMLSGSLASGGFEEGDDLDVSLVVAPGTKHLSYVACLALALPLAWRHRRRPHARDAKMPLTPKLVCINVVWTEAEARPFARQDEAMALEVALSRAVWGGERWRAMLALNPDLVDGYSIADETDEVDASPSALGKALRALTRPRWLVRALDGACYRIARALHAWVRWHRRGSPEVRARIDRLEATKHPYAILDREPRRRAR